jgi:hypothetical protein
LPDEIVKVDVLYRNSETGITTPIELWAGFIGLEQNMKNYALTPTIGWMIRKKDVEQVGLQQKYEYDLKVRGELSIKVKEIPSAIYKLNQIKKLTIEFTDRILIPDRLAELKIDKLYISGKTSKPEREKIRQLFPNTEVRIDSYSFDVSIEAVTMDAQQPNLLTVKGKVTEDDTNEPISGASVMVKGTTIGTVTDVNGNFSIRVEQGKILLFSFIGYDTYEINVSQEMVND